MTGVADYRGEVVPVIDLRVRFGLPEAEVTRRTKWIIVDVDARFVALVVDAVTEVFGTGGQELRPVPSLGGGDDVRGISGRHESPGYAHVRARYAPLRRAHRAAGRVGCAEVVDSASEPPSGGADHHRAWPEIGAAMTALTGGRIAKLLGDAEPETRRLAVQQLAQLRGADVAPLLAKALGDLDWRVRKEAASVASSIDPRDSVLAELRTALADRVNLGLRNAAVEALVGIGPDALPVAIEAYDSLDEDGRKLAVEVLAGVPDVRGTVALTQALRDEDPNVRVAAAEALGRSGDAGEEARQLAITALLRVLASEETMLKLAALDALARLDAKLSWRTVEAFAKDPILKRYALAAAAASREVDAIRALAEAVGDSSSIVAREAVIALGEAVLADPDDAHLVETASAELRPMTRAHTTVRMMAEGDESIHARGMAITSPRPDARPGGCPGIGGRAQRSRVLG